MDLKLSPLMIVIGRILAHDTAREARIDTSSICKI